MTSVAHAMATINVQAGPQTANLGLMTTPAPAAIEVAGLTKVYGRQQVVTDVSFTVKPGTVTGSVRALRGEIKSA